MSYKPEKQKYTYNLEEDFSSKMTKEDFVYSRIGMALISAQRVESITDELLKYLIEFNDIYVNLTTSEFLEKTAKSRNGKRTLGTIFNLLKLNPKLIIEKELDEYLTKRNKLVHSFSKTYLKYKMDGKEAIEFCYDFGRHSERIEYFFKGFIYLLSSKLLVDKDLLLPTLESYEKPYEYFKESLKNEYLRDYK